MFAYTAAMPQALFFVAAVALADISPPPGPPQVTLDAPSARVDGTTSPAALVLTAEAHNTLTWAVDSVVVGVLYAGDTLALEHVDPRLAYPHRDGAGTVVQQVRVTLPAGGHAATTLRAALPENVEATAFVAHVLGYTLADGDAATFLGLLATDVAADEWAACAAFGLTGDVAERRAARLRWAAHIAMKGDFAEGLLLPVTAKPTQAETFRRVFAVRALGVLGGPAAEDTLAALRESPDLARFDSALQVLRVGRASGSPFETPLSFAVPVAAVRMRDVVDAALDDVWRLDNAPREAPPLGLPAGGVHAPQVVDLDPPWWTQREAWALLAMGAVVGAAWLILRRE